MSQQLSIALCPSDRVSALATGAVGIPGYDPQVDLLEPEQIFERAAAGDSWDICEMSLSTHCILRSRGDDTYLALPVFPGRSFRHRAILVNTEAGIKRPEDLAGKRIGIPEYQLTAIVWVRGILQDRHGVAPADVDLVQGGVEQVGRKEKVVLDLPAAIRISQAREPLLDLLARGDIDALIAPRLPSRFPAGVQRLFADPRKAEQAYHAETGLFPLMHIVVVRRELLAKDSKLADALMTTFEAAKDASIARLASETSPGTALPWTAQEFEETRALMGEDFWPYGIEANRGEIDTFLRYAEEQYLTPRRLTAEDVFGAAFALQNQPAEAS
jgi:4,5-dihydroxyphthalate decarboxylase